MIKKFIFLWVFGLLTLVPYGIYYLLFEASREDYALVITLVLFWIFGYWAVVGPLVSAAKVYGIIRLIDKTTSGEELKRLLQSDESREVIIETIASENNIPNFVAARIYRILEKRLRT